MSISAEVRHGLLLLLLQLFSTGTVARGDGGQRSFSL
jgi:hypothetical protein